MAVQGPGKYGAVRFSNENAQVSAEKVVVSGFMLEIAGQHNVFHRQFIDVRGTSYCTILCTLRRKYVVI